MLRSGLALTSLVTVTAALSTTSSGILSRKLGGTDLVVSECCLGGMTWGNQNTDEDASTQLSLAFDYGVNFIDTAEGYPVPMVSETQGATDRAIAKWMKSAKMPRDEVVISTKVCGYNERYTWFRESGEGTRLSKSQIHESVEGSLKRLDTDYIDLLQFHWPERAVGLVSPDEEIKPRRLGIESYATQVEAIGELLASGKVRHWGLSNENAEGMKEFLDAAKAAGVPAPSVVQNAYSLLQREDEMELVKTLGIGEEGSDVGYIPYSPLSGGVLSGKYSSRVRQPKRSRLSLVKGYEESFKSSKGPDAVEAYVKVARKYGVTPTQLAIAHCNSRSFVSSTIIGATSLKQLAENLQGFRVEWTQEMEDDVLAVHSAFTNPWRVQVAGMG